MFHDCDPECKEYRSKDHPIPHRWEIGEYKFNRCPRGVVGDDAHELLTGYGFFKNGILPRAGGWMDQSNKYVQAMIMIDGLIAEHQKEQAQNGGH